MDNKAAQTLYKVCAALLITNFTLIGDYLH